MCRLSVVVVAICALALAVPSVTGQNTLAAARARLQRERQNIQRLPVGTQFIIPSDPNTPNVLTACANEKHEQHKATDKTEFMQFINGSISKAMGRITAQTNVKTVLVRLLDEALSAAGTVQRLDRITEIIACVITRTLTT